MDSPIDCAGARAGDEAGNFGRNETSFFDEEEKNERDLKKLLKILTVLTVFRCGEKLNLLADDKLQKDWTWKNARFEEPG